MTPERLEQMGRWVIAPPTYEGLMRDQRRRRLRKTLILLAWLFVAGLIVGVCMRSANAQVRAVAVAPVEPASYRVALVGDSQNGPATFGLICQQVARERVDLFVHLGDAIQNAGTPAEWLTLWAQPLSPIAHLPRLATRGNHDDPAGWAQFVFPLPVRGGGGQWGAFTVGGVRWLILDANEETLELRTSMDPGGAQRRFVDAELAGADWRAARWRVAIWHQPAVTSMWYAPSCWYQFYAQPQWVALMDRLAAAGCNLVGNGHAHGLQVGAWPTATSPMLWIVSGGGGGALDGNCAPLSMLPLALRVHHYVTLDVSPAALVARACRVDGSLIHEVRR